MDERQLGRRPRDAELPEPRRNELLRRADWRFMLHLREAPRMIDFAPGPDSEAMRLVSEPAGPGEAGVALVGFPSAYFLRAARNALAPGGEIVCRWHAPRFLGPQRARRRLRRGGFVEARICWPGPQPNRPPQFWLPLESREAIGHLLDSRPARTSAGTGLRRLWRWVMRLGLLAPVYAIARLPDGEGEGEQPGRATMLLTGGHRSINKVVALEFEPGRRRPLSAVKFARVAEAEPGLQRESAVLGHLAEECAQVEGIPGFHGSLRRCGRLGIRQEAIEGDAMLDRLTPNSLAEMARRVTDLLIELGRGSGAGAAPAARTTVDEHLALFERKFAAALDEAQLVAMRSAAARVGGLPVVCEHRDCSPWNLVLASRDRAALLDWESAEPRGLPGLDLIYFLANAAFVLDGALEAGTTLDSYGRLLDPRTPHGAVAAAETARYCEALAVDPALVPDLRLLCWMVHCRSDYEHLRLEVAGDPPPARLAAAPFLGLLLAELRLSRS